MAKAKQLWPLALCLWLCLGALTWAQVQIISAGGGGVGAAGAGNGVNGFFADGTAASSVDSMGLRCGRYWIWAVQIGR